MDKEITIRIYRTSNYEGIQEELQDTKLMLLAYESAMNTGINATTITLWLSDLVARHIIVKSIRSQTKGWKFNFEAMKKEINELKRRAHCQVLKDKKNLVERTN